MIKNRWDVRKTQRTAMIKQFLKYSKCKDLDTLLNLSKDDTERLVNTYLLDILAINTENVVRNKMYALQHFYEVNYFEMTLKGYLFETPVIEHITIFPFKEISGTQAP